MLLDSHQKIVDGQTINTSENGNNVQDFGGGVVASEGTPTWALMQVDDEANTDNTIACTIYGADNEAMSTNKVALATITKLAGDDVPFHKVGLLDPTYAKQYYRAEFTVGGTGPSMTVDIYLGSGPVPSLVQSTQGVVT